jgi:hypothetical protein
MSSSDYPFCEIVLYAELMSGDGGGSIREFPAIVHRINEDGTVNLTLFTDYRGGPGPVKHVERAPCDEPTAEHWRPRPVEEVG